MFRYKFHNQLLPSVFDAFLILLGTFIVITLGYPAGWPKARTNFKNLNIRFQGVKVWNDISDHIKLLPLKRFKNTLNLFLLININCKFIINIFFLAFRCLILAHLVFLLAVWIFSFIYKFFFSVQLCFVCIWPLMKSFINNLNKVAQSL